MRRACCYMVSGRGCALSWRPRGASEPAAQPGALRGEPCLRPSRRVSVGFFEREAADQGKDGGGRGHRWFVGDFGLGAGRGPRRRRHEPPQPAPDSRKIGTRPLPGEDPGDPLGDRRLEQGDALGRDRGHGHDFVARPQDPAKRLAAPHERLRQQGPSVEVQQVERQECRCPTGRPGEPAGQLRGVSPSRGVDDDQLTIEDGGTCRDADGQAGQLGQRDRQIAPCAVHDADLAASCRIGRADHDQRPLTAPPRLEEVLVRVERRRQRPRKHRPQVGQIGQLVGLEVQRELVGHGRSMVARSSTLDSGRPDRQRSDVPRPPRPDDLYRLRVAAEPRPSPDGRHAVVALPAVARGFHGYRDALWIVPTDGSAGPRQLTLGAKHDHQPRFSPDGTTLAFISDRRSLIEEEIGWPRREPKDREDLQQVHLLSLAGGEARRLTDLPRGLDAFEWSPDGDRLVVVSTSHGATSADDDRRRGIDRTPKPGIAPESDYRFIDRLDYMLNGAGFTYDRIPHLWLVDVATGAATRLTDGRAADREPAWSPGGKRNALPSNRRRYADIFSLRLDIHVVNVWTPAPIAT